MLLKLKENTNHILRLKLITPGNFGTSGGSSRLDRPLMLDIFQNIPYIPNSALKGVIAGKKGNVYSSDNGCLRHERVDIYGMPDHEDPEKGFQLGTSSKVNFGDGELLCFPISIPDGGMAWIFPHLILSKYMYLMGVNYDTKLNEFDYYGSQPLESLCGKAELINAPFDGSLLAQLSDLSNNTPVSVVGIELGKELWKKAVETRTQTKIDKFGIAEDQSLRRSEFIPTGAVFLSLVTINQDELDIEIGKIQVGAWENIGCGFLEVKEVDSNLKFLGNTIRMSQDEKLKAKWKIREKLYDKFEDLPNNSKYREKLRSVINDFGLRWRIQGLSQTLAFCLAKARYFAKQPKEEHKVYRSFLSILLDIDEHGKENLIFVRDLIESGKPPLEMEIKWLLMKKLSETMLK